MSPSRVRSGVAAGLAATLLLAAGLVRASAQNAEPRFEVASIKRQTSTPSGSIALFGVRMLPNGIDAGLSTVRMLIMAAYQVADYQIVGGPTATTAERYQISARAPAAVTPAVARQMLKTLLQDRFALKARIETRETDVHALVLSRSDGTLGPGLTRTSAECAEPVVAARKNLVDRDRPAPAAATPPGCVRTSTGSDRAGGAIYSMGAVPIERLVSLISDHVGGPVIDRTGLTGLFDIRLEIADQRRQRQPQPFATDSGLPTLRDALPERLGLTLETGKGPIEVVVIESVERPSEN